VKSLKVVMAGSLLLLCAGTSFAMSKNLPKELHEGVKGTVREGQTGTRNENAAKQMKDLEKQEKRDYGNKPTPTPKK